MQRALGVGVSIPDPRTRPAPGRVRGSAVFVQARSRWLAERAEGLCPFSRVVAVVIPRPGSVNLALMSSAPAAPFGRLLTAMATAFKDDGSVDLDATARIAAHLVDNGNDGVVVSGTTGEAPTTTVEEDAEILAAVKDAVGSRASVIAGVGTNATAHSIELAKNAAKVGVDGILLVAPYYNKPSQRGVQFHFDSVIGATDLPVMLYDVPGRVGIAIGMETYAQTVKDERVVAVKDAVGDMVRATRLADMGYAVYSGDDPATLSFLAHGGCGLVSVVGHVAGNEIKQMIDTFLDGDHAGAHTIFRRLMPAYDAVMGVPNYGATTAKAALQLLGVLDNRNVRGPLVALDEAEHDALREGLAAAGLI